MITRFAALLVLALASLLLTCGEAEEESFAKGTPAVGEHMAYRDSIVLDLEGEDSTTVLQLLQRDHSVHALSTAGGAFVEGIDDYGDNGEYFWIYTVNDTAPTVACDKFVTSAGDKIKWHFRRIGK